MSEQSKCPFTGAGTPPKFPTGRGTSNRDWWPNGLNLKILSQHSSTMETSLPPKNNFLKLFLLFSSGLFASSLIAAETPDVALSLPPSKENPRNSEGDFVTLKDGTILFIYTINKP